MRAVDRCFIVISVLAVLSCLSTFTEAKLRLPYTTPVIQTSHPAVVDPETGKVAAVLPVTFTVTVADSFSYPVELVDGIHLKGASIVQTHVFTGASIKLVFDVPNPGLDFVMNVTSDEYPVVQDQYGSLWKAVEPLRLEVIKQDTKFIYDVGSVGMTSYQSQSESVDTPPGGPRYDYECYRTKACCGLNSTHYRKYALVDSPVPPYACTDGAITYVSSNFLFQLRGVLLGGDLSESTTCKVTANEPKGVSVTCSKSALATFDGITVSPSYFKPSFGFALCRQGSSLTDRSYEASPVPVTSNAFCSTSWCIGYTPKNYMNDRVKCLEYPLGYYTSLDGNNSNQFSFYEQNAFYMWEGSFRGLKWIDDVGMSSSVTIQNISLQGGVPASTGWTLTYADFPLPLTNTLQPLFPIGRPTRVTARFNDATSPTAVVVTVEYVSFSNFTGANWTIQTCVGTFCSSSQYPAAADTNRYPTLINATVHLSSLDRTPQLLPSEVVVTVTCETTPTTNPFHTLLRSSTVTVDAAIEPPATQTVKASLAREPQQKVPSPYAASLGASSTVRIICQGDYRFSTAAGTCVPLTDRECAVKYRGRRIVFNTTTNACFCRAPRLTSPLMYRPLPDPLPPPKFTEESIRELMKSLKVPKFMQSMESAIANHDIKVESQEGLPQNDRRVSRATAAAKASNRAAQTAAAGTTTTTSTGNSDSSLPAEHPGFYELSVAFLVVTGGTWVFILFRDVFYKLGGVGPWSKKYGEMMERAARPPPPTSVSPVAQTPPTQPLAAPLPRVVAPPNPIKDSGVEARNSARRSKEQKKDTSKTQHPAPAAATPAPPPSSARPDAAPQPFTSSSHQQSPPSAAEKRHRSGRKNSTKPHRQASHDGRSPRRPRHAAPTWDGVPAAASAPPRPRHFDAQNFAAEHHTPFGYPDGGYAHDNLSPRGEFTGRSGRGDDRNLYDAYEYMPAPPAVAEDPEGQRWCSFLATPPRSPPTEGASWGSRGFAEDFFAKSPPYAAASFMPDPYDSPRSATAHSMRSGQPSPFGSEQYPARSPVRQSSRVEVLSSNADETKSDAQTSADAHPHGVESVD